MFKKSISSKEMKTINNEPKFPVKTKFCMNNEIWTVKNSFITDNTEMRTIISTDGTEEILTLTTLLRDAKSEGSDFKVIE